MSTYTQRAIKPPVYNDYPPCPTCGKALVRKMQNKDPGLPKFLRLQKGSWVCPDGHDRWKAVSK